MLVRVSFNSALGHLRGCVAGRASVDARLTVQAQGTPLDVYVSAALLGKTRDCVSRFFRYQYLARLLNQSKVDQRVHSSVNSTAVESLV